MMRKMTFLLACVLSSTAMMAADAPATPKFARPLAVTQAADGRMTIKFALSAGADVEVAVLNAEGRVVRHLAAGVLGGENPPPAPLKGGLEQSIEWDGLDDYRHRAEGGPFSVRVRAGMSVKLEQIAGGSPYLYFLGGHGDHNRWGITGVELKSDGKVYVAGHSSALGPVAIRQYDIDGNLYVGQRHGQWKIPPVFKGDRFAGQQGRQGCVKIVKYAPTGSFEEGNLFPAPPKAPSRVYEVNFGAFDASCIHHTPRFDVDEFGRILYPTSIQPRVTLMDNAGNGILHFGTWGNVDSKGGLAGDRVPTRDVPLACPNSVAATDDYIYVTDIVNLRILRLRKQFALQGSAGGE
jgi:hypothetical protein